MENQQMRLNVVCRVQNISDIEKEIGQLKMVVGFILAKLPYEERQAVIQELNNWGLPDAAEEFDQFANPRT